MPISATESRSIIATGILTGWMLMAMGSDVIAGGEQLTSIRTWRLARPSRSRPRARKEIMMGVKGAKAKVAQDHAARARQEGRQVFMWSGLCLR